MCDVGNLVFVGGGQHGEEAGRNVQHNGLKQQKVGCSEFMDYRESLLGSFIDQN